MNKYIDADMLIKKYIDTDIKKFSNSDVKIVLENLKQNILKAPTIDLVICAECKWGKPYSDKQLECDALGLGGLKFPNDFCSYAERRE